MAYEYLHELRHHRFGRAAGRDLPGPDSAKDRCRAVPARDRFPGLRRSSRRQGRFRRRQLAGLARGGATPGAGPRRIGRRSLGRRQGPGHPRGRRVAPAARLRPRGEAFRSAAFSVQQPHPARRIRSHARSLPALSMEGRRVRRLFGRRGHRLRHGYAGFARRAAMRLRGPRFLRARLAARGLRLRSPHRIGRRFFPEGFEGDSGARGADRRQGRLRPGSRHRVFPGAGPRGAVGARGQEARLDDRFGRRAGGRGLSLRSLSRADDGLPGQSRSRFVPGSGRARVEAFAARPGRALRALSSLRSLRRTGEESPVPALRERRRVSGCLRRAAREGARDLLRPADGGTRPPGGRYAGPLLLPGDRARAAGKGLLRGELPRPAGDARRGEHARRSPRARAPRAPAAGNLRRRAKDRRGSGPGILQAGLSWRTTASSRKRRSPRRVSAA